ncbi:MAG: PEP-CTERM sorting domain-containing protein, partial [Phycisphaerae bacterium]|nr:PEP-CTERM sorting domain-containing protein [Tepidisphaeraceae bacterium]
GGVINSGTGNPTGGGGGSGGGILLAASVIDLTGTLDASGGDGGYRPSDGNDRAGGGGGGGRIALYYDSINNAGTVVVAGGTTQTATVGGAGSSFTGAAPVYLQAVPEPGAGLALVGGIGLLVGRRRRTL